MRLDLEREKEYGLKAGRGVGEVVLAPYQTGNSQTEVLEPPPARLAPMRPALLSFTAQNDSLERPETVGVISPAKSHSANALYFPCLFAPFER